MVDGSHRSKAEIGEGGSPGAREWGTSGRPDMDRSSVLVAVGVGSASSCAACQATTHNVKQRTPESEPAQREFINISQPFTTVASDERRRTKYDQRPMPHGS